MSEYDSLHASQLREPVQLNATGDTRSVRNLGTRVLYSSTPVAVLSERNISLLDSMNRSTISDASMSTLSPRSARAFRRRPEMFSVHRYASALAASLCNGSPRDNLTARGVLGRIAENTARSYSNIDRVRATPKVPRNREISRLAYSKDPDIANSARRLDPVSAELAAAVAQITHHATRDESIAFGFDNSFDICDSTF